MNASPPVDFAKMRVGMRNIDDISINLGSYKKVDSRYGDKTFVLQTIYKHNYAALREISRYFYESSGIYYRLCRYLAYLFKYDWYVTPIITDISKEKEDKILKEFSKVLLYLDQSNVKKLCGNMALDVIVEGAFYGMILDLDDRFGIQKLPTSYCRSRYYSGLDPVIELNLQFFDSFFTDASYKLKVLSTFPKDIQKAYVLYKEGKLQGDYPGDLSCWVALDPAISIKISLNDCDFPLLASVIPSIIDLDEAQDLDKKKTMQQLLKIIVQKLPLNKNSELIFDVDEAKDIHNNAVAMLRRAIGVDVLTTFADVSEIDTRDRNSTTSTDDLEKVERTVYNNSGSSHNLFNADGNLATANSIITDSASIRDLILQFAAVLNKVIVKFNRKNHWSFRAEILQTTEFNYQELSKLYKEQAAFGYQKMLPQIALGHSQSSILATLMFENEVLHLAEIMVPPQSSNTMSSKDLDKSSQRNQIKNQENQAEVGRPEKPDNEKSDKTLANIESEA